MSCPVYSLILMFNIDRKRPEVKKMHFSMQKYALKVVLTVVLTIRTKYAERIIPFFRPLSRQEEHRSEVRRNQRSTAPALFNYFPPLKGC